MSFLECAAGWIMSTLRRTGSTRAPRTTFPTVAVAALVPALLCIVLGCNEGSTQPGDTAPPSRVRDLRVFLTSESTVLLTWACPEDAPSDHPIANYEMRRNDGAGYLSITLPFTTPPGAAGDRRTFLVTGLTPNKRFDFSIRSRDQAGNWSSLSNVAVGHTIPMGQPCAGGGAGSGLTANRWPLEWGFEAGLQTTPARPETCPPVMPPYSFAPPYWAPSCSANGRLVAFGHVPLIAIRWPFGPDCPYVNQDWDVSQVGLWIMDLAGGTSRYALPTELAGLDWSPDGRDLAIAIGYARPIVRVRVTGSDVDPESISTLASSGGDYFPAWSPDGNLIAYDSTTRGNEGIQVVTSDGLARRRLAVGRFPDWSPDGNRLIFVGAQGDVHSISLMDPADMVRLTYLGDPRQGASTLYPQFSPDGTQIAFVHREPGSNLWIMNADGSRPRRLTEQGISDVPSFAWLSTNRLVYTYYDPADLSFRNGTLWTVDANTGESRQLTFSP